MSSNSSFTNLIAENYEKYMGPMFFVPYAEDTASRLTNGKINSLLEVACGTGQVTRLLRKKLGDAAIIATDLNPGMIEVAKKIVNVKDNIEWQTADAQELPFEDNSFDAVICQFGLMFVPDKQKAVNEAFRVLKTGGRFIFTTWDKIEFSPFTKIVRDTALTFFKEDPPDFYDVPFSMYETAEMESLMSIAGFNNIKVENVKHTGYSESAESAVKGLTQGTPAYLAICERDESLLPEIQKAAGEKISKEFGALDLKLPLQAWVTEGVK